MASRRSFTASTGTRRRGPPRRRRCTPAAGSIWSSSIAMKPAPCAATSGPAAGARSSWRASRRAASPGFDPDQHLARIGCANQTTMLSSESLEIGEMFRAAMRDRYGDAELPVRFRAFDTICSATQDRQDAVERAARRTAGRPDDRDWRSQQQQHVQPGADLRRAGADVSHCGSGRAGVGRRHPAQAGRTDRRKRRRPAGCRPARSRLG